jgi:hypothetical protein
LYPLEYNKSLLQNPVGFETALCEKNYRLKGGEPLGEGRQEEID